MKRQLSSDWSTPSRTLEHTHLNRGTQARDRALVALNTVAAAVSMTQDVDEVLQQALALALEVVDVEAGAILVLNATTNELVFRVQQGWRRHDVVAQSVRMSADQGLPGRVMLTGQPAVSEDISCDSQAVTPEFRDEGVQAMALAPIRARGQVLGVLGVMSYAPYEFSPDKITVISAIADQIGIALDNARLFDEAHRQMQELATLQATSTEVASTLDLQAALETIVSSTLELTSAAAVEVHLREAENGELTFAMALRRDGERESVGGHSPSNGPIAHVARSGEILMLADLVASRLSVDEWQAHGMQSLAVLPLKRATRVLGVLAVAFDTPHTLFDHESRILSLLADQLAIAVDSARLYEETQQRMAELTAVQETNLRVVSSLDTKLVLDTVARNALELVSADDVHISLHDPEDGSLTFGTALWRGEPSLVSAQKQPDRFTWSVLNSGRPLVINHAREHPDFDSPETQMPGVEAIAGFPMLGTADVVGVMTVAHLQPHVFSADEQRVLGLLASQAAVAITNARLYEETRKRLEELTVLHEVALAATSTLALETLADRVTAAVQQNPGCEHLHLLLANEERKALEPLGHDAKAKKEQLELREGEGLAGWVVEHGTALRVGDVSQEPRYIERIPGVRSALVVPLMVGDRIVGVIDAASSRRDAFSADDERLMTTVARQLAVAVENARLYQETEQRLAEVSALYQLARQISTSLNVQEVLDSTAWSLKEATGCRGCSIALLDPLSNILEISAAAGIEDKWKRDFRLRLGEGVAGRVALEGEPIYVPNTLELGDFVFFDPSVRSLLTVPLNIQDKVIGTLSVDSDQPDAFSVADERLLIIAAAQAAIAIENARLYARLEQRAKNLAEVYAEMQEADRLKDEMMQNISHELRTPLTFVKGYVELLLAGEAGSLTDEQKGYLQIVVEKTNAVTKLMSDIIFLQQADRVSGKRSPVSLTKLAQRALRGCTATAQKAGLTLIANLPDDLPLALGDEVRLLQVFDNLLQNAIKFSPEGSNIVVTIEGAGPMVQASVSDQGIGISKDQQYRIFERFYQVDGSTQRRFGGVGLGLAIVKRIVESHKGQIWVESEPKKGSTFYFTIPKYRNKKA